MASLLLWVSVEGGSVSGHVTLDNEYNYDDWAELLASFFFDEAHAGAEILFAVDELSLADASGLSEEDAGPSLGAAVRRVIGAGWDVRAVCRLVECWRTLDAHGPHPALPFLALTVLAASRMGGYAGYAPHKFYVPLRRALIPDDTASDPPGTYLDHISDLWSDLARWANRDLQGERGRLCVRDPGRHYGRGLAIQHALVKSSDLRHLDAFFRRIGLQPHEDVPPSDLRRALGAWTAARTEPWARRLARISTDDDLVPFAEAMLKRESHRWDGKARDPRTGRPVGRLRLGLLSPRRPVIELYAQWGEGLPESVELTTPSNDLLVLRRRDGWYEPQPIDGVKVADALAAGVILRGDRHRFEFRTEDIYALGYDVDLGIWVSVDAMSYGEKYHLIARDQIVPDTLRFLQSESSTDPSLVERAARHLPLGWKLIADARIDSRPRTSPPEPMRSLVPAGPGPRLRLYGGLLLPIRTGTYLRGGEPVVTPSSLSADERIEVREARTGLVELFHLEEPKRELELWRLELPPGTYEICNDGSRVAFRVEDGIADAAGPGAGSVASYQGPRGCVVGTAASNPVPPTRPITILAPRPGTTTILLGVQPGEHHLVKLPRWLRAYAGHELLWKDIDAWPEFDPVWCLAKGRSGQYEASIISRLEPAAVAGETVGTPWARAIGLATLEVDAPDDVAALWHRYRTAAMVPLS